MTRRGARSLGSSPVLVGAVTVLVVVVAVFLAYNANNGLPFVPTSRLVLQLPNGATVGTASEVREGGYRIGVVDEMRVVRLDDGRVGAAAVLKLDDSAGRLPVDTTFAVRLRGAIGAKYVDVQRGRSHAKLADGATVPLGRTTVPVELDEILSAFDAPTRAGIRRSLRGSGDGVAGRGPELNRALAELPDMLGQLAPVMANLADRRTRLSESVRATGALFRAIAPVAAEQADLFGAMADTFGALARHPAALRATIEQAAPTLRDGARDLRAQRPFLTRVAALLGDAEATARRLRTALPALNDGVEASIGPLRRTPPLADELRATLGELDLLARDPASGIALRGLRATVDSVQPQASFYGPFITVCNALNLWMTFFTNHISVPSPTGTAQYALVQLGGPQDDALNQTGANEFAVGRNALPGFSAQHLHSDPFPSAVRADGSADCEWGQAGYRYGANANDDTPDRYYRRAVVDAFAPGTGEGPVYGRFDREGKGVRLGPARVPPGQTFTRRPGGRAAPER